MCPSTQALEVSEQFHAGRAHIAENVFSCPVLKDELNTHSTVPPQHLIQLDSYMLGSDGVVAWIVLAYVPWLGLARALYSVLMLFNVLDQQQHFLPCPDKPSVSSDPPPICCLCREATITTCRRRSTSSQKRYCRPCRGVCSSSGQPWVTPT